MDWLKEEAAAVGYILLGLGIIVPCLLIFDGFRGLVNKVWGVNDESH